MNFNEKFLNQMKEVISKTNYSEIEKIVEEIGLIKKNNGRIFFCGSGGGAGHASHAAADFKKLLNLESYSVTDNVSFLTAAINDIGWETSYTEVLKSSNFTSGDALFVFSVGGGSIEPPISSQIANAIDFVSLVGGKVLGIVGRDGGYTAKKGNATIVVPTVDEDFITPHTEGMQAYLWHFLVSHPDLTPNTPKWEGV
jgi:D-sedoheptulose 7-phosphate isomerase